MIHKGTTTWFSLNDSEVCLGEQTRETQRRRKQTKQAASGRHKQQKVGAVVLELFSVGREAGRDGDVFVGSTQRTFGRCFHGASK